MSDIQDLQNRVLAFRDERDWKQFHNPKDSAIALILEAAEFLEHFQWKNPEEVKEHLDKKHSDVSDELADVLFWVLLIAHDMNIDLKDAFEKKMQQNEVKYPVEKAKGRHTKYTEL